MKIWHPGIESLRRLGEGADVPRVERHVEGCVRCRNRLEAMEVVRSAVHHAVQIDPPANGWSRVRETLDGAGGAGGAGVPPLDTAPLSVGFSRPALKAAVLVLFLSAAGLAALVPASPVRGLLERAWGAGASPEAAMSVTGIATEVPAAGLTVRLSGMHQELQIHVRMTDGSQLEIESRGVEPPPVFGLGAGEVNVSGGGPGVLRLLLPRDGGPISVQHGDGRLLGSEDGRLIVEGRTVSGTADLVLSLPVPAILEAQR